MEKTEQPGHATSDEGAADTLDRSTSSIPWRSRSREDREPRQVLVVIVQGLGDLVLAIPALKAIRRRFPRARLTLAAKAGVLDVLAREPFVDEHLPLDLPRDRWLHLAARGWDLTRRIRRRRFDLLINLTTPLTLATYLKCRLFNALCRPRSAIGGTLNDCLCLLPRRRGIRYRHETHEVEMKFRLLHGLVSRPLLMMPSLTEAKEPNAFVKHIRSSARHRPVLAVCAGCLRQSKQWPPDKFVQTLRLLSAPLAPLVVLLGSQGERDISHAIASALGGNVMDLTGQVSTGQLAAVVAAADCLLTIDTGLMHVAAATGTPLVAILGAEIPQRYHPVVVRGRARVFYRPSPCSPCLLRHCPHQRCMAWIEPAQVAEAVVELTRLRSRPASPKPCAGRSNGASELESCATSERRP